MSEIEKAIAYYLSQETNNKPFKGQIIVKVNCVNGNVANTSIFISRGGKEKKLAFSEKIKYVKEEER